MLVLVRREAVCEVCGATYHVTYTLHGDAHVRYHQAHYDDAALEHALRQYLRRRSRCPVCHAWQREPRRSLLREDLRSAAIGLGGLAASVAVTLGLSVLGAWLGQGIGLAVGLVLGLVATFYITRWMLLHLL